VSVSVDEQHRQVIVERTNDSVLVRPGCTCGWVSHEFDVKTLDCGWYQAFAEHLFSLLAAEAAEGVEAG